ncbi:MAG: hypothetical protein GY720_12240 [bacterium]|nr:hypothetical protein [bacterium]
MTSPAVALTATIDGNGFWVLLSNGEISAHGTAIHHGDLKHDSGGHPDFGVRLSDHS